MKDNKTIAEAMLTPDQIINIIQMNGLSIRQIPLEIRSCYAVRNEADKIGKTLLRHELITQERGGHWNFRVCAENRKDNPAFEIDYENRRIYRLFIPEIRIPKNAGHWMCKQCTTTDSLIKWSYDTDNLAPTLAESIELFLQNTSKPKGL